LRIERQVLVKIFDVKSAIADQTDVSCFKLCAVLIAQNRQKQFVA